MITKTETPTGTTFRNDTAVEQTFYVDKWRTLKPGEEIFLSRAELDAVGATGRHPRTRGGR
jgi:hypothetical protein